MVRMQLAASKPLVWKPLWALLPHGRSSQSRLSMTCWKSSIIKTHPWSFTQQQQGLPHSKSPRLLATSRFASRRSMQKAKQLGPTAQSSSLRFSSSRFSSSSRSSTIASIHCLCHGAKLSVQQGRRALQNNRLAMQHPLGGPETAMQALRLIPRKIALSSHSSSSSSTHSSLSRSVPSRLCVRHPFSVWRALASQKRME